MDQQEGQGTVISAYEAEQIIAQLKPFLMADVGSTRLAFVIKCNSFLL